MSDQPKPIGEWTADSDGVLLPMHRFVGQYAKEIADAHNAELAAERHENKMMRDQLTENQSTIPQLREQLAVEREKYERASKEQRELINCVEQVWNALEPNAGNKAWPWGLLSVAKKIRAQVDRLLQVRGVHPTVQQLREQLAAERENVHRCEIIHRHVETIELLKEQLAEAKSGGWLSDEALDEYAKVEQEVLQLRKQLAAERDVVKVLRSKDNHWRESNAKLLQQLTAEREREEFDWGHVKREYLRLQKENTKLTLEKVTLATQMVQIESKRANEAEQEVQTLVDALKNVRKDNDELWTDVTTEWRAKLHHNIRVNCDAALAKVKEGK